MVLDNRLNITNQVELARAEERISKQKAKALFETGEIDRMEVGTFHGLSRIHECLFADIYAFAGKMRDVNLACCSVPVSPPGFPASWGGFRFAPVMYLKPSLAHIDAMAHGDFDEIIEKYVEMNIAHPFREGNGRAMRIWLDCLLKAETGRVVDWSRVDKDDYLAAMVRSPVRDVEIRHLLKDALTDQIHDRDIFMKGLDASYYYEGYSAFRTGDV